MVGEFQTANICLYATYLQPRTITAPSRERHTTQPGGATIRKEEATVALDVFDKTVKRTEHFLAYLHGNGYDITDVADNLRQLEDMRGDLTRAFTAPSGYDLRRHLQNVFEVRVVELCSAIRSLKDRERGKPQDYYPECMGGKGTAFPLNAGDYLPTRCDGA